MPNFDIILVVWNRLEYTKRTIASLISSGAVADCERFIIVDNRSTEEGMEAFFRDLYENMPEVSGKVWLLRRGKNDGMAAAVNDALGFSRAKYVFLSNNDVEYSPDFHKRMFSTFANQPNIGVLGVWRHTSHGFVRNGVMNQWFREMDDVPAVGWMLPKRAMEKVGLLEERGPCFVPHGLGEDTNYIQRMKAAGFLTGVLSKDIGVHIDGY